MNQDVRMSTSFALARQLLAASAFAALSATLFHPGAALAEGCLTVPTNCVVTSTFGPRIDPVTKNYSTEYHQGVDFGCPMGTPDVAAAGGTVVVAGFSTSAGNWVVIRSPGNGPTFKYMHHERIVVSIGNMVNAGQLIAYTGNTGRSTGPHMHFQMEVGGKAADSMPLFCSKPGLKPGVLQGAAPAQTDQVAGGPTQASAPPEGPAPRMGMDGSLHEVLTDAVSSRALNPDYVRQLSTLTPTRLYAELSYMKAIDLKVQHERSQHRERVLATQAMLQVLAAEATLRAPLEAQRLAAEHVAQQRR